MTREELFTLLQTAGYPVTYYRWNPNVVLNGVTGPPDPPYIIYRVVEAKNFYADGAVYFHFQRVHVELYTRKKDETAQNALEAVLNGAGIGWKMTEIWIDSEKLYECEYEIEV